MAERGSASAPITIRISGRTLAATGAIVFSVWLVYILADFLVLLFACIVFATALAPFVHQLEKRGIPRWIAVSLIYSVLLLLIGLVITLIVPTITQQVSQIIKSWPERSIIYRGVIGRNEALKVIVDNVSSASPSVEAIIKNVVSFTSTFINGVATTVVFFVLTFYMLMHGRKVARFATSLLPQSNRVQFGDLLSRMSNRMGYWFRGQIIISVMTFVVTWIALSLMGVEYALTLALIAGIAEFIPLLGSWLGGGPAVLVALGQSPQLAIFTALYFFVWQTFQGQIISPQVMRQATGVPSILILINVLLMAKLFGFIGVFLATPIAAALAVLVEEYSDRMQHTLRRGLARTAGGRDR